MGSWMKAKWNSRITESADVVAFLGGVRFATPSGEGVELRQHIFVAFRGVGTEPATRLAAADKYGAVLYGRSAA